MGVIVETVSCLRYDDTNSRFYSRKLFKGDTGRFWLCNGVYVEGVCTNINSNYVILFEPTSGKTVSFSCRDIENFDVISGNY